VTGHTGRGLVPAVVITTATSYASLTVNSKQLSSGFPTAVYKAKKRSPLSPNLQSQTTLLLVASEGGEELLVPCWQSQG
jgi:hypothetical protein